MNWLNKVAGALTGSTPEPIPEGAVLIDVRSPGEYASGYVEGAVNVPLGSDAKAFTAVVPDKEVPVVVYCASGMRSASVRSQLVALGYSNVINGGGVSGLAMRLGKGIRRA